MRHLLGDAIVVDVQGKTGTIQLSEDAVTVRRKGTVRWRTAVPAIERRIPFDQIRAVRMRPAGALRSGCIEFVVEGWARGDNAVLFAYHQQTAFEQLSGEVTRKVAERSGSPGQT